MLQALLQMLQKYFNSIQIFFNITAGIEWQYKKTTINDNIKTTKALTKWKYLNIITLHFGDIRYDMSSRGIVYNMAINRGNHYETD